MTRGWHNGRFGNVEGVVSNVLDRCFDATGRRVDFDLDVRGRKDGEKVEEPTTGIWRAVLQPGNKALVVETGWHEATIEALKTVVIRDVAPDAGNGARVRTVCTLKCSDGRMLYDVDLASVMKRRLGDSVGVQPIKHGPMYKATVTEPETSKEKAERAKAMKEGKPMPPLDNTVYKVALIGEVEGKLMDPGKVLDYKPPHAVGTNVHFFMPTAAEAEAERRLADAWHLGYLKDVLPDCSYAIDTSSDTNTAGATATGSRSSGQVRINAEQVALGVGAPVEFTSSFTQTCLLGRVKEVQPPDASRPTQNDVLYDIELMNKSRNLGRDDLLGKWISPTDEAMITEVGGFMRVSFLGGFSNFELMTHVGDTYEFGVIDGSETQETGCWYLDNKASTYNQSVWVRDCKNFKKDKGVLEITGEWKDVIAWKRAIKEEGEEDDDEEEGEEGEGKGEKQVATAGGLSHEKEAASELELLRSGRMVKGVHHVQLRGIFSAETMQAYRSMAYSMALSARGIQQRIYDSVVSLRNNRNLDLTGRGHGHARSDPLDRCATEVNMATSPPTEQLLVCAADPRFSLSGSTSSTSSLALADELIKTFEKYLNRGSQESRLTDASLRKVLIKTMTRVDDSPITVDMTDPASGMFSNGEVANETGSKKRGGGGTEGGSESPGDGPAEPTAATFMHAEHIHEVALVEAGGGADQGGAPPGGLGDGSDKKMEGQGSTEWTCSGHPGGRTCEKKDRPASEKHYTCCRGCPDFVLCERCFQAGYIAKNDAKERR